MKLNCPACDAPVPPPSINIEQMVAVCPQCGEVFRFGDQLPARKPHLRKPKPPEGIEVIETPEQEVLRFSRLPVQPMRRAVTQVIYLLIALLMTLVAILVIRAGGFTMASLFMSAMPFMVAVFIPVYLINRQVVTMNQEWLETALRPLSALAGRRFNRDEIAGVITRLNIEPTSQGQRSLDVDIRLKNGDRQIFLRNLNPAYAGFIAQEIHNWLHGDDETELMTPDLVVEDDIEQVAEQDELSELPVVRISNHNSDTARSARLKD